MAVAEPDSKAVGIWIRVSTESQAQGDSPEHHEKRARAYAASRGWFVTEVYHLEAVSGKAVMDHPETRRMLDDIRCGRICGLIFSKLARLARNTHELLEFADRFREHGAHLICLQESIDTSTPAGRLFYTMVAAMAQWEREEISDRTCAAAAIRAKLGKPTNGKIPYGYQWKDRRVVIEPDEARIRRLAYELFLQCRRKLTVARMLNDRGFRTRAGNPFDDETVDRMIRDPSGKGMHRAHYTKCHDTKGKHRVVRPESEWVWMKVQPIVSEAVWEECNNYLDERRQRYQRRANPFAVVFDRLVFCQCGQRMYTRSSAARRFACEKCHTKMPILDLEAMYFEQLEAFFCSRPRIESELNSARRSNAKVQREFEARDQELTRLQREVQNVYALYAEEQIDAEAFSRLYAPFEAQRRRIQAEVDSLRSVLDRGRFDDRIVDKVLIEAKDVYGRWRTLEEERKRRLVASLTERIVVGAKQITIVLVGGKPDVPDDVKWQSRLSAARTEGRRSASTPATR
ncbi:MAG: recombinase family protein [Tepidisphaeraceae bacterium]